MNFTDFLDKYFLPDKQNRIILLLKKLEIFQDIVGIVDEFYNDTYGTKKYKTIVCFSDTVREFIVVINNKLQNFPKDAEKEKLEVEIIELAIYFIRETFILLGLPKDEYFDILKYTIVKTYKKHEWNFEELKRLLNLDNIEAYEHQHYQIQTKQEEKIKLSKKIRLVWNTEYQLDFFIDDIANTYRGMKGKSNLRLLFDPIATNFKVQIKSAHLESFLTLFSELHENRVFVLEGSRGLFKYLEAHIEPLQGDIFPNRPFRKIKYEASQKEEIKNTIYKQVKPLIDKCCKNGQ